MKILVTGFDPFGGESINPAIESVKRLPEVIGGAQIVKLEIPTVVHKSLAVIREAILKEDPDMILSIGQAGGRAEITVERVGINVDDCRISDNEGNQPLTERVLRSGRIFHAAAGLRHGGEDEGRRSAGGGFLHGRYLRVQCDDVLRAACAAYENIRRSAAASCTCRMRRSRRSASRPVRRAWL